jgi:glycosyltransferase involved in cell wall biosynthesis
VVESISVKILTFADYYLPGFKAGGPIRTISAMVNALPGSIEFLIVTRDRDHTERQPYPGVRVNRWTPVGKARVLYIPKRDLSISGLARIVQSVKPDVLYANSMFSRITIRLLMARGFGLLGALPFVLAPRGEFSKGALEIRAGRKKIFLSLAGHAGLFHGLLWQASTESERSDILGVLGGGPDIRVSRNIAIAPDIFDHRERHAPGINQPKREGAARFVFLSRVSPMKNLLMAIELIGSLSGEVSLDIFGPADDESYARECRSATEHVQPNVKVTWHGNVMPAEVIAIFAQYDFFILPTLGENFGHVILESLSAGCPILLSDRTPWRRLDEDGVGWNLPIESRQRWVEALHRCVNMDEPSHRAMKERARAAASTYAERESAIQQNVALFEEAVRNSTRTDQKS